MQAPPALAGDAQEKHLEALLKLVLQDRTASRASDPAAAAEGASAVGLLKTHSSAVALMMKRQVWLLTAKTARPQEAEKGRKKGKISHR